MSRLSASFSLTDLKEDRTPYKAADASFELTLGDRPLLVEVPGQRLIPGSDEVIMQDRVFLIVIEALQEE